MPDDDDDAVVYPSDAAGRFREAHASLSRQPVLLDLAGAKQWPGRLHGRDYRLVLILDRDDRWFCGHWRFDIEDYCPPGLERCAFRLLSVEGAVLLCSREDIAIPTQLAAAYETSKRAQDAPLVIEPQGARGPVGVLPPHHQVDERGTKVVGNPPTAGERETERHPGRTTETHNAATTNSRGKAKPPGDPGTRARGAAVALTSAGKPISIRSVCDAAGVDRNNLTVNHPDVIEFIRKLAGPVRRPPSGNYDTRTGNIEARYDTEDDDREDD